MNSGPSLHSSVYAECMMVRWMCGVSLKDRKRSKVLYSLLGVQSVAEVMRRGRLRLFGYVERKNGDDWVPACRNVVVAGKRCVGRGRKTWRECVKDDTDEPSLHPEWAVFRDVWRGLISGQTTNPSRAMKKWTLWKLMMMMMMMNQKITGQWFYINKTLNQTTKNEKYSV